MGLTRRTIIGGLVVVLLSAAAAGVAISATVSQSLAELKSAYRRTAAIPFPKDNPYSDAKAELGRMLFFDPRISGPENVSCASCHNPSLAWGDGLPVGIGAGGHRLERRSPSILNAAWGRRLMWDGRFASLEEQALGPIQAPAEMNQSMTALQEKLAAVPGYRRRFAAIFPEEGITPKTIARALATFERTVVSEKAPFDDWIDGDDRAIDDNAKRGFALFNGKARCAACHSGWRFTDDSFHDIGLPSEDVGRGKVVPNVPILQHAFKTPGLRNIAQRGPYMHDGSVATLIAVMHHYNDGFVERPSLSPEMRHLQLSEQDCNDLVSFMLTLTSRDKPVAVPILPTKESR